MPLFGQARLVSVAGAIDQALDWANGAVQFALWTVLLSPATGYGIFGIVEAFRRKRKRTLRSAVITLVPPVLLLLWAALAILSTPAEMMDAPVNMPLFWASLLPLSTGFWAILLAFLIPEKPR